MSNPLDMSLKHTCESIFANSCKLLCNTLMTFLIFSSICMLSESLGRKLSRLAYSMKISRQIKLRRTNNSLRLFCNGCCNEQCNCPCNREEQMIWEWVKSMYYSNENLLIMKLIDEAHKLRSVTIGWDAKRCIVMISSLLLLQYSLVTGKLVGPVLESQL